jgi:hypothetical protein
LKWLTRLGQEPNLSTKERLDFWISQKSLHLKLNIRCSKHRDEQVIKSSHNKQ